MLIIKLKHMVLSMSILQKIELLSALEHRCVLLKPACVYTTVCRFCDVMTLTLLAACL